MNEQQAEMLARVFGGEAWQSGGGIWLAAFWRGDGKYIVFSGDAVCEYDSEEAFDNGQAGATVLLATGDEEWWVVIDDEGHVFYQDDQMEIGWRDQSEADREAKALASRTGEQYFAARQRER